MWVYVSIITQNWREERSNDDRRRAACWGIFRDGPPTIQHSEFDYKIYEEYGGNPVIFKWHFTILHCRGSKMYFQSYLEKIGLHWTKFTDIWQNMNVMGALYSEGLPKRCIYHYHCYFWPGVPVVAEAANGSSPFFPQLPQRICRPTQRWGEKDSIAVVIRVLNNYPIIEWVTIYGGFPHSLFPLSGSAQSNPTRESESCPTIFSKLPPIFGLRLSQ